MMCICGSSLVMQLKPAKDEKNTVKLKCAKCGNVAQATASSLEDARQEAGLLMRTRKSVIQ